MGNLYQEPASGDPSTSKQGTLQDLPFERRLDLATGMLDNAGSLPLSVLDGKLQLTKRDLLDCGLFNVSPVKEIPYEYSVSLRTTTK